ncbi:type II secretion system protein [Candidatus Zixiibacteriota bacterium]
MYQLKRLHNVRGYTMIELVMIIVIIGVLSSIAIRKMSNSVETAQYEQTKKELDALAHAIAGNPSAYTNGVRTDFGYVGDVGAMPPNLDALIANPGSYSSWDGPYITNGTSSNDFKQDGWRINYTYSDTLLRSTGSGANIDKVFAISSSALLNNNVTGYIVDADNAVPGLIYKDSLLVRLVYPNGTGGYTTGIIYPNKNGSFSFNLIPIGNHTLSVIYIPDTDTLTYQIAVLPAKTTKLDITFPADLW